MAFLRFLLLLSLAIWVGGLVFVSIIAETAFSTLPSSYLAGLMVRDSLLKLHLIGLICGAVLLVCSVVDNRIVLGRTRIFAARHFLVFLMLALTAVSQFAVIPRMDSLRTTAGEISALPPDNFLRAQFGSLHV